MRYHFFALFFGVFLLIYIALNGYIFIHGWNMMPVFGIDRWFYTLFFLAFSFSYIIGELLQQKKSSTYSDHLIRFGSLWFVGIVHFFFTCLVFDVFLGINSYQKWLNEIQIHTLSYHITWITIVTTVMMILFGYINARNPKIRKFHITLDKKNPLTKTLSLAVVSDIHLGPINGRSHIERIVRLVNDLQPDIILLAGDIVDGELDPVIRRDLGSYIRKFQSKYGVYGILGNHEYIGGADRAKSYLIAHDIQILQDEVVEVGGVTLVGRDDISSLRFGKHEKNREELIMHSLSYGENIGHQRKNLAELLVNIDHEKAIIVLDHQPKNLGDVPKNGVDMQFSGHTHNGQLWPLNHIVKYLFEVPVGYKKKGVSHIFVSPGVGTWGPPVRTNARPDILSVIVDFEG